MFEIERLVGRDRSQERLVTSELGTQFGDQPGQLVFSPTL